MPLLSGKITIFKRPNTYWKTDWKLKPVKLQYFARNHRSMPLLSGKNGRQFKKILRFTPFRSEWQLLSYYRWGCWKWLCHFQHPHPPKTVTCCHSEHSEESLIFPGQQWFNALKFKIQKQGSRFLNLFMIILPVIPSEWSIITFVQNKHV